MNKTRSKQIHDVAMKISKLLIDSELTINEQFQVLKDTKYRLDFCRKIGAEIKQHKLNV
jgi:hypothetical protein